MKFKALLFLMAFGILSFVCRAETKEVIPMPSPYYSSHPTTVTAPKQPAEVREALTPVYPGDGSRISLSNEEQKFYEKNAPLTATGNPYIQLLKKAWGPAVETHSFWALVLVGGFWAVILAFLIRKMAQSPPRKPPVE